jgi:putative lipoprotein
MNLKLKLTSAVALLLGTLLIASAFAQEAPEFNTVSGSVTYRQRIAMPPDAVLTVRVEDVSRADVPVQVLAETRETFGARQVPIAFSLEVPSAAIDPRFSYAVRATIAVRGKLRFTSTPSYQVLTRGAPNQIDLTLDAVPSTPAETTTPTR